jgi:hypothetical protein
MLCSSGYNGSLVICLTATKVKPVVFTRSLPDGASAVTLVTRSSLKLKFAIYSSTVGEGEEWPLAASPSPIPEEVREVCRGVAEQN